MSAGFVTRGASKETRGADGSFNGCLTPIWNANEHPELRPDQVYVTSVNPHCQKGPHLHKVRRGLFCCIRGVVRIVIRKESGEYETYWSGDLADYAVVHVPPGVPACIYNDGEIKALVINMPSPAWRPDAQDEHPVEDWNP